MGPIFGSLIDLIEKKVPSWFGACGSVSRFEVFEQDYFGYGSEKQSHVTDSGGSNLYFGE